MDRRRFLGTAAGLTAAALSPAWLARAFGDEQMPKDALRSPTLHAALRSARAAGKPLLVLVIPQDDSAKWERGRAFGEFINHASDAQLWPLALCEVVCATMHEVRSLVPARRGVEPLMVLVEPDPEPRARLLDASLADPGTSRRGHPEAATWEQLQRLEDEASDQRIAALARLLEDALAADETMLGQRMAHAMLGLDRAELARVYEALEADRPLDSALADRGAALVAHWARRRSHARRAELTAVLARAAALRLREQPVPGSHWARSSGCGTMVEGAEDLSHMVACGMGHVPRKSQRFLYFFSASGTR